MGCPAGIGPEIILRLHLERRQSLSSSRRSVDSASLSPLVVLGDSGVLEACGARLGLSVPIKPWRPGRAPDPKALNLLPLSTLDPIPEPGTPTPAGGRAMGIYIERAVDLIGQGELSAMVTCPIAKDMLNAGGYPYPGHTEMLAALCNVREYAMMMAGSRLRVTLLSIHRSLASVAAALTPEALEDLIELTVAALKRDFALKRPRVAVAALNPHAGESGMFGLEEREIIAPVVARAARVAGEECQLSGPWPPDTVFHRAARGDFDCVIAMYHDQGLIPFKLLHFTDGVNVTLGLPLVRTSVDHGTAYDIAGRGVADHASLRAAVETAEEIARNRALSKALIEEPHRIFGRSAQLICNGYTAPLRLSEPAARSGRSGRGLLIALEGIDGTGKSTQVKLLARRIEEAGREVVTTFEPTDGPHGRRLRALLANRAALTPEEELRLFIEDRRDHVNRVITPALAAGKVVITDRYYFSTVAYQGAAGHDQDEILRLNESFAPRPDLLLLLQAPSATGVRRVRELRGDELNDFEQEEYLERVAAIFDGFSGFGVVKIDAEAPVDQVAEDIWLSVKKLLE